MRTHRSEVSIALRCCSNSAINPFASLRVISPAAARSITTAVAATRSVADSAARKTSSTARSRAARIGSSRSTHSLSATTSPLRTPTGE